MYCSSCGGELTEKDAKCPYCGSINPLGAEAEYMEKLEYLREYTESLGNKAPLEYERQLKHHGNFALKIFAIVITDWRSCASARTFTSTSSRSTQSPSSRVLISATSTSFAS